jgi:hypothetical protein
MISVRDMDDGGYAVIDGMHRVTSLQELLAQKWQDIDYEHVQIHHQQSTALPASHAITVG